MLINWQVVGSSFVMIFLAELGDKTQLSAFAFASRARSPLSVFLGSSLALVLTTFIAVVLGEFVGKLVPEKIVKVVAGLLFLGFGAWTIVEALRGQA
jgi:putative Ca2+/H+ antiporter (TMEM165/GDT1 family)